MLILFIILLVIFIISCIINGVATMIEFLFNWKVILLLLVIVGVVLIVT